MSSSHNQAPHDEKNQLILEAGQEDRWLVTDMNKKYAEEVNQAMLQEVRKYPGQERQVMEYFQQDQQAMAGLRAPIFEEKVVDFIIEIAEGSERLVTPEQLMADPDMMAEEVKTEANKKPAKKKTARKKKPEPKAKSKAKADDKEKKN